MDMIWLKLISILIIFIVGLIGGILPLNKSLSEKGKQRLTLGNAFAGGIFLGAGLIHMLPDAMDNFKTIAGKIDFPFPALIAGIGFLLILVIEKASAGKLDQSKASGPKVVFPVILYLVLSIHSIIAGTSLGLEGAILSATAIFIAIIAHKGAASFALGVNLKINGFERRRHMITIAFFVIMTPLGVVLGTIFSHLLADKTSILFEMIFDSLAAGTFLYIAIVEIMGEVFEQRNQTWAKLTLVGIGFALMGVIAIWT
ncbi:MAG: ZIP family metal transporter [Candidatus Marinimicrobia bacterium]|nr:ZIP family metal transporter [Candidatus Neomarinimicrobiota bacterium]